MSKTGLQTINHQNNLALWSDQIADCRSSSQTVSQWCAVHGIPTSTYLSLAQAQSIPPNQLREMYNDAVETIRYLELCLTEERQQSDEWEYAYQQVADMLYG